MLIVDRHGILESLSVASTVRTGERDSVTETSTTAEHEYGEFATETEIQD